MSRFFDDIFAARTLYSLKTASVDCSKHNRQSKGLKFICWKCYTYVSMGKKDEDKIRKKMLSSLINNFYRILRSRYKAEIPEEIKLNIQVFSRKFESGIYNNNPLLESYMHYFDYEFLKIMITKSAIDKIIKN
tara:strand:- start:293 stop:691 length:399 start_codon:yes stop_codon:yes gene_type:complete